MTSLHVILDRLLTPGVGLEEQPLRMRIDEGRISNLGASDGSHHSTEQESTPTLDLRGLTVLPGLINSHEHLATKPAITSFDIAEVFREPLGIYMLRCARNARALLLSGITAIRECGARSYTNIELRDAIRHGLAEGPQIVACGQPLAVPKGHMHAYARTVSSVSEVGLAVGEQIQAGADFVKVHASGGAGDQNAEPTEPEFTSSDLREIVREAQYWGRPVAAHALGTKAVSNAISASVSSIEHGYGLTAALADQMAARGIIYVPTLSGYYSALSSTPTSERPAWSIRKALQLIDGLVASVAEAVRAGVRVAAGTDSFGDLVAELTLLHECGLSSGEVIASATSTGAAVLGRTDDIGELRVNLQGDLVAVNGNPMDDLEVLRSPVVVVQGGRIILDKRQGVDSSRK